MSEPVTTHPDFHSFNLTDKLKESIDGMGFETPTPVQQLAIPIILQHKT
jgi:superfamily II DNA/RNA helicase